MQIRAMRNRASRGMTVVIFEFNPTLYNQKTTKKRKEIIAILSLLEKLQIRSLIDFCVQKHSCMLQNGFWFGETKYYTYFYFTNIYMYLYVYNLWLILF